MLAWGRENAEFLAALSTILLTVFAAVQIGLEVYRHRQRERASAAHAVGPAWLARRSIAASLEVAVRETGPFEWARRVGDAHLDTVETLMLEALRIGSEASGSTADAARDAFDAFLAFADDVNRLGTIAFSDRNSHGEAIPNDAELSRARSLAGSSVKHLEEAHVALEKIAPRQQHEAALPPRARISLLSKGIT